MNLNWPPMPRSLTLATNAVHLFAAATDLPAGEAAEFEALLPEEEREKLAQLRVPERRAELAISRGVLRKVLSQFLHLAPQRIAFHTNAHGKPSLENRSPHFNMSHTAGVVMVAVAADGEVGIDVEAIDADVSCEEIAERFFTRSEHAALLALAKEERVPAFFRGWTRKESLLKATGEGIAAGLNSVEVPLYFSDVPIRVGAWMLHDIAMPPTHSATLAIAAANPQLHFWMVEGA